ncbi:hypothetical protein LTR17_009355 [Elasticomyces elasticus]|nr:hypothetical protein LTR17_009355 [Elasticomyces elasticus]
MRNPLWTARELRVLAYALRITILASPLLATNCEIYTYVALRHVQNGGQNRSWGSISKHVPQIRTASLDERDLMARGRREAKRSREAEARRADTSFWLQCEQYGRGVEEEEEEWIMPLASGGFIG